MRRPVGAARTECRTGPERQAPTLGILRFVLAALVAGMLLDAPAAVAGPICEDRAGEAVRCEDPRAMPLGWTAPLDQRLKRADQGPPEPTAAELGGVFALILLLFALIALMPDFDGWTAGATDKMEEEDDGRA